MKMKGPLAMTLGAMALGLLCSVQPAWAQHDHGGMPAMPTTSPEAAAKEAREDLTRMLTALEEKIEALEETLNGTDLKPAKRKKLEAKLQKLLDKKNKLIDDNARAPVVPSGGEAKLQKLPDNKNNQVDGDAKAPVQPSGGHEHHH